MRCLIDTSATYVSNAGISEYIKELILSLKTLDNEIIIYEFGYRPFFSRKSKLRAIDTVLREVFWVNFILPLKAIQIQADVIHCPSFIFPFFSRIPILITIHDLYCYNNSKHFNFWHRNSIKMYIWLAIKCKYNILVISNFVKNEIINFFPAVNPKLIHVIYSGVSSKRFINSDKCKFLEITNRYNFSDQYILTVSTIEPRKNLISVLKAFKLLSKVIHHDLVIVGSFGWKYNDIIDFIHNNELKNRVKFTGYVSDEELNIVYSKAAFFLFPSLYEGFGFTVLEAMKCGCPVITSNRTSLPEICGDAALYVDPTDIFQIYLVCLKLLESVDLKLSLVNAGFERVKLFGWNTTAYYTKKLYETLV